MAKTPKTFSDVFQLRVKQEKLTLTQQFKLLQIRKKQLEAKQAEVSELLANCEDAIFAEWELQGIATVKLDTGETVFTHQQYWAKAAPIYVRNKKGEIVYENDEPVVKTDADGNWLYYEKEDIIKALKASGFSELVSEGYNANSLSSVIREFKKNQEAIPEALSKVLVAEPTYSVRIRGLKVRPETLLADDDDLPY